MEFEKACSEIYYILEHMNPIDKEKIPETTIQFFRDNRDIFYKVELEVNKNLSEQNLKDETKAFIQILNRKYFSKVEKQEHINNEEIYKENINNEEKSLIVVKKENKIFKWLKKMLTKIGITLKGE